MSSEGASFDPIWERIFRQQEWGKYPQEHVIRFVARRFYGSADRAKVRLLDLGCGPGACAWFMAREGFTVSAIDGSQTAIERLSKRLAAEDLRVETRVGDIVALPWDNATFDGVVDNAAICCNRYGAAKQIIAEVRRVLKPGGSFMSASFTDRTWGYGKGVEVEPGGFRDITEGPLHDRGFNLFLGRAQLDDLFSDFVDVQVERTSWTLGGAHLVEMWIVMMTTRRDPASPV